MATLFVARSPKLCDWGADVGLSKHLFRVGLTQEPAKSFVAASGWAELDDWILVKQQAVPEGLTEETVAARLARKARPVDPALYPRLRGATGIYKVLPAHVESRRLIVQALDAAGDPSQEASAATLGVPKGKARPADFAAYLLDCAITSAPE